MDSNKYILLTIDVEDWFQVENFRQWNPHSTWGSRELRVEKNVHKILDLFDSVELKGERSKLGIGKLGKSDKLRSQPNQLNQPVNSSEAVNNLTNSINPTNSTNSINTPKATFFVLGWIAERLPHLVREILSRGHEVASHGCNHELPNSLTTQVLKQDLIDSKKLLEDIIGEAVTGYRAPSFAINEGVLQTIGECGYQYDSSYNSFSLHGRYGKIALNGSGRKGIAHKINENFYELPISNLQLAGLTFPLGGGGYFRLLPVSMFNSGVKSILKQQDAYLLYAHPWELDPNQPRVNSASLNYKFRHYINLNKTETRLRSLIKSFDFCRLVSCSEYLNSKPGSLIKK